MCQASQFFKDNRLKRFSLPFDWIFSSPNIVIDCINDDFAKFLDKQYYINSWEPHGMCGHSYYHPNMFNHHDVRLEHNHQYFTRCVDRFRKVLKRPESKLFLMFKINQDKPLDNEERSQIMQLNNKLSEVTTNYHILYVYHCVKTAPHVTTQNENITYIEFNTLTRSGGGRFHNSVVDKELRDIIFGLYSFTILDLGL